MAIGMITKAKCVPRQEPSTPIQLTVFQCFKRFDSEVVSIVVGSLVVKKFVISYFSHLFQQPGPISFIISLK